MATPKDWIVYVDNKGKTRACLNYSYVDPTELRKEGNKIIGYVSAGAEDDAIKYGDQVLRKD